MYVMTNKIVFILSIPLICCFGCNNNISDTSADEDGVAAFSADSMRLHVSQLADDSLMGRKPFTPGETKTVAYLEKQFKQAGLEPGNGNSYLQEVPMVNIQTLADPAMKVT